MSIDDITPEEDASVPAEAPSEDVELTQAQQDVMDAAVKSRIDGGRRIDSISSMIRVDIPAEQANSIIDSMDEIMFVMHGIRHNDVSTEVDAKIDVMQAENPREVRAPMTKKPEELLKQAQRMAARGKNETAIVAYLKENGAGDADAKTVAAKVSAEMRAARAGFEKSKRSAKNSAGLRIALGVVLLIVGFALMSSGAESSGRRSPAGVVVAGFVAIGSGIYELTKADEQSFERRVNEVLR